MCDAPETHVIGDLFDGSWSFDFVDRIFAVMEKCPESAFYVLTKHPEKMAEYMAYQDDYGYPCNRQDCIESLIDEDPDRWPCDIAWPLPNVALGVVVESQRAAEKRIPHLLRCPAALRVVSLEPLMDRVDLSAWLHCGPLADMGVPPVPDALREAPIGWVTCGVESRDGHVGRLLCDPRTGGYFPSEDPERDEGDWWGAAESVCMQCRAAGVPFFLRQGPVCGLVNYDPDEWIIKLPRGMPLESDVLSGMRRRLNRQIRASDLLKKLDEWAKDDSGFDERVAPLIEEALRDTAPRHFDKDTP